MRLPVESKTKLIFLMYAIPHRPAQRARHAVLAVLLLCLSAAPAAAAKSASKNTRSKPTAARIIYSGNFQGHVEPCG